MVGIRMALGALVVALVATSCGGGEESPDTAPSPSTSTQASTPADDGWDLVLMSDSSGWGVAHKWAALTEKDQGVEVDVTDLALPMYSGKQLLTDLRTEGSEQRESVRDAEVVMVWANPLGMESASGGASCVLQRTSPVPPPRLTMDDYAEYAQLWRDIVAEIRTLRGDQPTAIRLRDHYDAAVADHTKAGTAEECTALWQLQSQMVRDLARELDVGFASIYALFNGPDGIRDPIKRGLIRWDGEHQTGRGQRLQARMLHDVGYAELR